MLLAATAGVLGNVLGLGDDGVRASVKAAANLGLHWLLQQQDEDDGWHSETYGNMRGGAGNTALALAALAEWPEGTEVATETAYERGVRFLTTKADAQGLARPPTEIADYPVLTTALLLSALSRRPMADTEELRQRLCQGLLAVQRGGANEWPEDDPDFGGWGMTGDHAPDAESSSPSNISATAAALYALDSQQALTPAACKNALKFLERCQWPDKDDENAGGFAFTARPEDPLNKAGSRETETGLVRAHPYSTTTCDGVSALVACGVTRKDRRLSTSLDWLSRNADSNDARPPNFRKGLMFYEAQAWADVCRAINDPRLLPAHDRHVQSLLNSQQSDGSWVNSQVDMREDDPLIATAFALRALAKFPALASK